MVGDAETPADLARRGDLHRVVSSSARSKNASHWAEREAMTRKSKFRKVCQRGLDNRRGACYIHDQRAVISAQGHYRDREEILVSGNAAHPSPRPG